MQKHGRPYSTETVVNLITPREVGVTLVPFERIEEVESSRHWASVFGSISTAFLGAFISLIAAGYDNITVTVLLLIPLLLFAAFAFSFYSKGTKELNKTRKEALGHRSSDELMKGLTVIKDIVGRGVFKDKEVLPLNEFESTISVLLPEYQRANLTMFCADGLLSIEDAVSGKPMVKYHKDLDPQKTIQRRQNQDIKK